MLCCLLILKRSSVQPPSSHVVASPRESIIGPSSPVLNYSMKPPVIQFYTRSIQPSLVPLSPDEPSSLDAPSSSLDASSLED